MPSRRQRTPRNILLTFVGAVFLFGLFPDTASASWLVDDDDGLLGARGVSMPVGPAPSASVDLDDVTLSWPAVTLPGGGAVEGYQITRYTSGGTPVTPNANCAGVITTTSCVEFDVAAGTWTYRVKAVQGSWVGANGSLSNAVVTSNPDFTPPVVSLGALIKSTNGDGNVIRQAGGYYVYANANDVGTPQSGVATVTADVSTITTGSTGVPLAAGSYVVNGVTYGYRSTLLTANATLTAGAKTISFTATDQAGNSGSLSGHVVIVDNTPPAAVDIQTINGGVVGQADTGDRVVYTFSEPIDAQSILPGWNGSSATATVRIVQNTSVGDRIQVWNAANTANSTIGAVRLGSLDYVTATVSFTNSTIVRTGSTITVTLGTPNGPTGVVTVAGSMRWTPSASALDFAGNPMPTTNRTESGALDIDF